MKQTELKPFQELHHTDKLLRLDWFGGVKCNSVEIDNPLVECLFTPFEFGDTGSGGQLLKPMRYQQFVAGIAVGYLPTLFIGQFFRNGRRAPLNEWLPTETISFDLDVSDVASTTECTLPDIHLDPKSEFISPRFMATANRSGIKKLHGILRRTSNDKIKKTPAPQDVFIHEMELIRFYLTNSTHSCKNIFNGAFSDQNIGTRVVNEIHEPKSLDPRTGAGRFVYRHGYKEEDAPALGRILLDPTGLTLKGAQRVHSKIVADRVNLENDWFGYPRTYFPFRGRTNLVISGRRLKTVTGFIFLAYRIHSCSAPFPFKSLSYCDEISPGGEPAPPSAPIAFPGSNTVQTGPGHEGGSPGESKSNERPSTLSAQLQIELGKREYSGLAGIPLKREKLRDSTHRAEKKIVEYRNELTNASTGAGTTGDSSAIRQSLTEPIIVPSPVTPDLETFINVIKGMRAIHSDWDVTTIIVGTGSESDGEQTSYFPEVECQKHKHIMRQFSYTDDAKLERRRFICAQIKVNGQYVYLFEAQRRLCALPQADNRSPYKESLPVLLLHPNGHEEIQGDDFLPMIEQTVKKKTWPDKADINGFIRDHTVHGRGIQSVDEMCARVVQLVTRNIG